jgi:molybdenum cofactor synthesis domain-containing protein
MKLPSQFRIAVITLSDRAFRGDYEDLSGPRIRDLMMGFMKDQGWEYLIELKLIPDDPSALRQAIEATIADSDIIFTTGGTGIGPRDITVDTVRPFLSGEIPGIMEFIRVKYGGEKPNALLSRAVAGIAGRTLVYTLPGSPKAVEEYMTEIMKTLRHALEMIYGIDSHSPAQ